MSLLAQHACSLHLWKTGLGQMIQIRCMRPEILTRIRPHPEAPKFLNEYSVDGPPKGKIYDKKPFRMELKANKWYFYCTCGHSKQQPFCDGAHKALQGTSFKKGNLKKYVPLRFKVETTKEYWLCNCKQTDDRPFCDGTHKREDIQAAIR
ncbi:iron-sulfur domain-containing 3, mitochondrial-like [Octopus vulgaris]|uniref:Iron-sulfur domain-containing 3, mitochondrial-like n=1 Tax=Octopus vulgaris TaxID=6645 RepID=A0AA36ALB5_OCTVU|nr:iron-sulfur domain-containing 3, mitochondrial-like [Octopus vulgaris]